MDLPLVVAATESAPGTGTAASIVAAAVASTTNGAAAATAMAVDSSGVLAHQQGDVMMETAPIAPTTAATTAVQQPAATAATTATQPVAWDAHLDNPSLATHITVLPEVTGEERRAALSLTGPCIESFIQKCEFIALGCFCGPSFALQLLGIKQNSYPFDWVRCTLDGILNCLETKFEDFLTYSTYQVVDQHVVFGGTRWGGSFWHHNLEAPVTAADMSRRIVRFYGRGEVPASTPRIYVRVVNSTRELDSVIRLRTKLKEVVPESQEVYILVLIEFQQQGGPAFISGTEGLGLFFYSFTETEFREVPAPGKHPLSTCGGRYARAIASAISWWAGSCMAGQEVRSFASLDELSRSCDQFDGGDAARELFVPRRFYGQQLNLQQCPAGPKMQMQSLISSTQLQAVILPSGVDVSLPFQVQCFGRALQVKLPIFATAGLVLHLCLHNGLLSGTLAGFQEGQAVHLAQVAVEEHMKAVA